MMRGDTAHQLSRGAIAGDHRSHQAALAAGGQRDGLVVVMVSHQRRHRAEPRCRGHRGCASVARSSTGAMNAAAELGIDRSERIADIDEHPLSRLSRSTLARTSSR